LKCLTFLRYALIASHFASVAKQYPAEAAELFAAAQENAKWRYRSYLRMLSTNWTNEE
jgi:pyruvate-ferredoxin/flavodoxin oxidoreductase